MRYSVFTVFLLISFSSLISADTTNCGIKKQLDTTNQLSKAALKTNYQFLILASVEGDTNRVIVVEWSTGEVHKRQAYACKKLLVSYRLNQYLLIIGDINSTVVVIPINQVFSLQYYVIEINKIRMREVSEK